MKTKFIELGKKTKKQESFIRSFVSLNHSIDKVNSKSYRPLNSIRSRYKSQSKETKKLLSKDTTNRKNSKKKKITESSNTTRITQSKRNNLPSNLHINNKTKLYNSRNSGILQNSNKTFQIKKERFNSLMKFSINNFFQQQFPSNDKSYLTNNKRRVKFIN